MSKKKRVIHVEDLIIKADNVRIEQQQRGRRDPFFFGPKQQGEGKSTGDVREAWRGFDPFFWPRKLDENLELEPSSNVHVDDHESPNQGERRPFSWI